MGDPNPAEKDLDPAKKDPDPAKKDPDPAEKDRDPTEKDPDSAEKKSNRKASGFGGIVKRYGRETGIHGLSQAIGGRSRAKRIFWSCACLISICMFFVQFNQLINKYFSYPKKVNMNMLRSPVPFPAITFCNHRNLDIMVVKKLSTILEDILSQNYSALHYRPSVSMTDDEEEKPDQDNEAMSMDGNSTQSHTPKTNSSQTKKRFNIADAPWIYELAEEFSMKHGVNGTFLHAYLEAIIKYTYEASDDYITKMPKTLLSRTSIATNIEQELVEEAGVQWKDFALFCRYAKKACNSTRDIKRLFDPFYTNCYTYKPNETHDKPLLKGVNNGWSATLLVGGGLLPQFPEFTASVPILPYIYLRSAFTATEGIRVVIHHPDTTPHPQSEGFDVPSGFTANFAVTVRENKRLGEPHGKCAEDESDGRKYRALTREKECIQSIIVDQCGCKDSNLPYSHIDESVMFCTDDSELSFPCKSQECIKAGVKLVERVKCAKDVHEETFEKENLVERCKSFPECHGISYETTYSLAAFPAKGLEGEGMILNNIYTFVGKVHDDYEKQSFYYRYFAHTRRAQFIKDFNRVNVFISDSTVLLMQESEDYLTSQFLSDIGGQLGLWIGVSIIGLWELLEFLFELVEYAVYGRRKMVVREHPSEGLAL